MSKLFKKMIEDKSGATAIEYGLIAALIAVVIITAVTNLGTTIGTNFNTIKDAM
jgi:pilus assembly protein Flp/PilA